MTALWKYHGTMYDSKAQAKAFTSQGRRIHREAGDDYHVEIFQHKTLRWMRFGDSDVQSAFDLSLPWYPIAGYCISMLCALCLGPTPRRALNLGLGGGSFERFFAEKLPSVQLVTVEPHSTVIDLAHEFFHVPPASQIEEITAEAYLQKAEHRYDLIFVDMFDDKGHIDCLGNAEFYAALARNLSGSGAAIVNLVSADQQALLQLLMAIRPTFPQLMLSADPDSNNIVLLCCAKKFPDMKEMTIRATAVAQMVDLDLNDALSRFITLPESIQTG